MKTMNRKHKLFAGIIAAAVCSAALAAMPATADETAPNITVTIANAGTLEVAREPLTLTDADNDGSFTINDALILVHDQYYDGGSEAGFASAQTDWGMSITKLWGVENGGSYGYTVNDIFASGLGDTLSDGDALFAYVYTDAENYTDEYTYFDIKTAEGLQVGDTLTLTLTGVYYDANWNQVTEVLTGAEIIVNGERKQYYPDEDGKFNIPVEQAGDLIITATLATDYMPIVPPVFRAVVAGDDTSTTTTTTTTTSSTTTTTTTTTPAPNAGATTAAPAAKTGDSSAIPALGLAGVLAAGTAFVLRRKQND